VAVESRLAFVDIPASGFGSELLRVKAVQPKARDKRIAVRNQNILLRIRYLHFEDAVLQGAWF
jgi:hypothetical protein